MQNITIHVPSLDQALDSLKLDIGEEFGFTEDRLPYQVSDCETEKQLESAMRSFVIAELGWSRPQAVGTPFEKASDIELLTAIANGYQQQGQRALEMYRQVRRDRGLRHGDYVDNVGTEMDDTYMDSLSTFHNEALLRLCIASMSLADNS